MISQSGKMCGIITINGQKQMKNGISTLDKILQKLVKMERKKNKRKKRTTMLILDSKTISNADTARVKGYDAGKKKSYYSSIII